MNLLAAELNRINSNRPARSVRQHEPQANSAGSVLTLAVVGLANEIQAGLGDWLHLAPFGDFPHQLGTQRIDQLAANELAKDFTRQAIGQGRNWRGAPFFIGHPDVPGLETEYPNKTPYGWIKELDTRGDGIYGRVEWTDAGKRLAKSGAYASLSPFWMAEKIVGDGRNILRPVSLKSVGFTNSPNLPVKPLSVANNQQNENMSLSPKQIFEQIVNNLMTARRCSYQEAHELAQLTNRELYAVVLEEGKTEQQRADDAAKAAFKADAPAREDREAKLRDFIKAKMDAGNDYDLAWTLAKTEMPELFAAMQSPSH